MKNKYLIAEMVLHNDTTDTLSKYLGISPQCLRARINGRFSFKIDEIMKIKDRYNLSAEKLLDVMKGSDEVESERSCKQNA